MPVESQCLWVMECIGDSKRLGLHRVLVHDIDHSHCPQGEGLSKLSSRFRSCSFGVDETSSWGVEDHSLGSPILWTSARGVPCRERHGDATILAIVSCTWLNIIAFCAIYCITRLNSHCMIKDGMAFCHFANTTSVDC